MFVTGRPIRAGQKNTKQNTNTFHKIYKYFTLFKEIFEWFPALGRSHSGSIVKQYTMISLNLIYSPYTSEIILQQYYIYTTHDFDT